MRNIIISTINHNHQRYPTVGDWFVDERGDLHIKISRLDNPRYEELVAIHELCEALLCLARGIPQEAIDKFDMEYEANRVEGDISEPGNSPNAPYQAEHIFATVVERMLAATFGVDWKEYETTIDSL